MTQLNRVGSSCCIMLVAAAIALGITGCSRESEPVEPEAATESPTIDPALAASAEIGQTEQSIVAEAIANLEPEVRLGIRLFHDNRLSNPGANLATSCRTCHVPPEASGGKLLYTDGLALSVVPSTARGSKRETLRNTPSLLDASLEISLNTDGAFSGLEELLTHKLTSDHMGWLPGEEDRVKDEIFALLLNDQGEDPLAEGSYIEQFQTTKDVDLEAIDRDQAFALVIASLTDYINTLVTSNSAPWDALAYLNRFNEGLAGEGDRPQDLSGRIYGRIANQEGRVLIRFPNVYDEAAYQGMKAFIRVIPTWSSSVEGMEENIANCIACHVPPKFSDGKFHNIGVTQSGYDAQHGDGAFAKLDLATPSESTRSRVSADDPSRADLGRWNVDAQEANIAAFKTPKLRNIAKTGPYMHDGSAETLEEAIRIHIRAAEMASSGELRNPDPELQNISGLTDQDVTNLVAFLETLSEVPTEEFRDFRINNVRIRQDPLGEQTYDN